MELEFEKIKFLRDYVIPHIALTVYKYKATATRVIKQFKTGLTIDQMIILQVISHMEDLTQQDVADILYKDKSNISRMIEALAKKNLLIYKLDLRGNRAVKRLEITQEGKAFIQKFIPLAVQLQKLVLEGIEPDEIETVKRVMKKIRNNLNKDFEAVL